MSEHEEEKPIFEDLGLSTDDLTFAEPGAEAADAEPLAEGEVGELGEASVAAVEPPEGAEAEPTEAAPGGDVPVLTEEEHPEAPEEEGEPKKKPLDVLFHAQWIGAVAACAVVALVFSVLHVPHAAWHAFYVIAMIALVSATWITRKFWATFAVTALYTVFLAGTLAALLTGVYWLGLELAVFDWDLTAKRGKQAQAAATAAAAPRATPAHGAPPSPSPPPRPLEKRK